MHSELVALSRKDSQILVFGDDGCAKHNDLISNHLIRLRRFLFLNLMRNLSLVSSVSLSLPASGIKNTTFDLDENVTYLAAQKNVDGEAEVEVWKLESVETTVRTRTAF